MELTVWKGYIAKCLNIQKRCKLFAISQTIAKHKNKLKDITKELFL